MSKSDFSARKGESHNMEKKMEQRNSKIAETANQVSFEGFGVCSCGFMITQNNACGIKVIARIDEYKELVWEAVVPFKAIYHRDSITEADANRPISVCFAVKGLKHADSKSSENSGSSANNSMSGGGMGGGGRGMGGGGRGGGKSQSASNPMEHLYENTKTWKFFGIAYQR